MKIIGIYKITSPTGKVYIGQSRDIEKRWKQHKYSMIVDRVVSHLKNSLISHGYENHTFEVLEECKIKELNKLERHYQDLYDVLGENGLNLSLMSSGEKVYTHSEVSLKKLSNAGKLMSKERRLNMSKLHKGKVVSITVRQNISKAMLGLKRSEEVRLKIKEAAMIRGFSDAARKAAIISNTSRTISESNRISILLSISKPVINIETGEIFATSKAASLFLGKSIGYLTNRLKGNIKNDTGLEYLKQK